jgi:DNA-binding protein HU-beta
MTKAELITEIALSTGYDKNSVAVIVEAFMEGVKKSMARGKNVYMRGFGSFVLKSRKEKMARNITKRTTVYVPAHCVPDFKPAAEFKACVHDAKPVKKAAK